MKDQTLFWEIARQKALEWKINIDGMPHSDEAYHVKNHAVRDYCSACGVDDLSHSEHMRMCELAAEVIVNFSPVKDKLPSAEELGNFFKAIEFESH